MWTGKAAEVWLNSLGDYTPVGDQEEALGSQFQASLTLAFVALWGSAPMDGRFVFVSLSSTIINK